MISVTSFYRPDFRGGGAVRSGGGGCDGDGCGAEIEIVVQNRHATKSFQ